MDRRSFFRFGLRDLKDAVLKRAPEILRPEEKAVAYDLSILTQNPLAAERLTGELFTEPFGGSLLRLRQSVLTGLFPGGLILFENNRMRLPGDGVSMLHGTLRQLYTDLHLGEMQENPTLVRYVNVVPPYSREVTIFCEDKNLRTIQLDDELEFEFETRLGPAIVSVSGGKCTVKSASCAHQICTAHPPIQTPGQRITCVPSRFTCVIGIPAA